MCMIQITVVYLSTHIAVMDSDMGEKQVVDSLVHFEFYLCKLLLWQIK